ncbi:MAG: RidA family protein [Armatimonadota bacterium]
MPLQHRGAGNWAYLTGCAEPGVPPAEQAKTVYQQLLEASIKSDLTVVHERIYGSLGVRDPVIAERQRALEASGLASLPPPTYIQGAPCDGDGGLAGVHMVAVGPGSAQEPAAVQDVIWNGRRCGRSVQRADAEFLYLADMAAHTHPGTSGSSRPEQAAAVLEAASEALSARGLSFRDVARTWVYLDDILSWYGEFNEARNAFFRRVGLMGEGAPDFVPTSTGIEGCNASALACTMDVLAVRGAAAGHPPVWALSNPRQSEAYDYGSSFSRGACVAERDVTHIHVAGTAAIDEEGSSVCPGDLDGQVEFTLRNVDSLLAEAGAGFGDIVHATVFFKRGTDASALRPALERMELPSFPAVTVWADVCRDELLFEMDAEALVVAEGPTL